MIYLKSGFNVDAVSPVLTLEVYGAIQLVVWLREGFEEHRSGGQPQFPAISVRLNRIADSWGMELKRCV